MMPWSTWVVLTSICGNLCNARAICKYLINAGFMFPAGVWVGTVGGEQLTKAG